MPKPSSILICGRNPDLLETRRLVLESAGFVVTIAKDTSAAIQILMDEPVDIAMLCHTLSTEECQAILAELHSSHPETKVLMLHVDQKGCTPADTDPVVSVFDGPRKLISKVHEMVRELAPIAHSTISS